MSDYVGNRLEERIPFRLKIRIKGRNFKEKEYVTSDISPKGFFIPCDASPPLDLSVDIKVFIPDHRKAITAKGRILRVKWAGNFERIEGFAVEIRKIDRENEDKFLGFINKVSKA